MPNTRALKYFQVQMSVCVCVCLCVRVCTYCSLRVLCLRSSWLPARLWSGELCLYTLHSLPHSQLTTTLECLSGNVCLHVHFTFEADIRSVSKFHISDISLLSHAHSHTYALFYSVLSVGMCVRSPTRGRIRNAFANNFGYRKTEMPGIVGAAADRQQFSLALAKAWARQRALCIWGTKWNLKNFLLLGILHRYVFNCIWLRIC